MSHGGPPLYRCAGCGCPVLDHAVDDEERRECTVCECRQYLGVAHRHADAWPLNLAANLAAAGMAAWATESRCVRGEPMIGAPRDKSANVWPDMASSFHIPPHEGDRQGDPVCDLLVPDGKTHMNRTESRSIARRRDVAASTARAVQQPIPPHRQSLASDGRLKDTPANRALAPRTATASAFTAAALTRTSYFKDAKSIVFNADVKETLRHIAKVGLKVDCIVTSPPFYGQRDYGVEGQIGLEEHPKQFLENLLEVFALCSEVLSDTGSLWVNLGDTYWSGKGAHKSNEVKQGARRFGIRPQDRPGDGKWARPKQLLLIPHRFAIAMQDAGWLVRNDNVWIKPNPVPDQVRDRCSISHEYVFHFTKARWYYFNQRRVGREMPNGSFLPLLDTWDVPPSRGNGLHRAAFSEELVRVPILASTPPNGIVLDPFNGSGTSMLFARQHGFRSIGIDISGDYCKQAVRALRALS